APGTPPFVSGTGGTGDACTGAAPGPVTYGTSTYRWSPPSTTLTCVPLNATFDVPSASGTRPLPTSRPERTTASRLSLVGSSPAAASASAKRYATDMP